MLGGVHRVGEREHFDEHDTIDRVHVVDVDFSRVRFERVVEVLVHEGEDIRLLHRDDIVGFDGFGRIDATQLFVEHERLLGRRELLGFDFAQPVLEVSLEREPNGERKEISERERRFVDRLTERLGHALGNGRLRRFETCERAIQSIARDFVLIGEIGLDLPEHARRKPRVMRHRTNGGASYPHDHERSTRHAALPMLVARFTHRHRLLEGERYVYSRPDMTTAWRKTDRRLLWITLASVGSVACASQKVEPQVASSAAQTHYAVEYPDAIQSTSNEYVNTEGEVGRITTEFPKYPAQLKDPPWPLVVTIVNRADEAGRSASYVEARRDYEATQAFFTQEREEITRRMAGSAQHAIKKKEECDVDVSGAISSSFKESVQRQVEKRLRAHSDAHTMIERYRESLGKANAAALEKQADDISEASYATFIRAAELKTRTTDLLREASQVQKTLEQSIAEERAFQAEPGRAAGDKKASAERIAKMEDAKVRVQRAIPALQTLEKDIDQRNAALKKEYSDALDTLRKAAESKITSK